jgi:hypothetical protein
MGLLAGQIVSPLEIVIGYSSKNTSIIASIEIIDSLIIKDFRPEPSIWRAIVYACNPSQAKLFLRKYLAEREFDHALNRKSGGKNISLILKTML